LPASRIISHLSLLGNALGIRQVESVHATARIPEVR